MKLPFRIHLAVAAVAAASTALAQAPAAAPTVEPGTVVLRSGDFTLTKAEYEKLVIGFDRASGAPTTGPGPQSPQTGAEVARLLALVSEAQRRKVDQDPKVAALMRVRAYTILGNALLANLQAEARKDEAGSRAFWESDKVAFVELTTRQILIRHRGAAMDKPGLKGAQRSEAQAKAEAEALRVKLKAGADFAELAKKHSEDETTRAAGGALPPFTRGAMQAEFEQAAFALSAGDISEPVKTKFGYHLIQLVERRPFPFERVRSSIEFMRARQALEKIAATPPQLNDAYFVKP
ncbi:MAG: peptidyl-prolyl cis-trans isomerase [Burkholderiales bacterium]|nr:peptidyl-prolyl cis-trans isomerase [Burkholderiales bacterium]